MDPMLQGQLKEWFILIATFGFFAWVAYLLFISFRRRERHALQRQFLDKFSTGNDFAAFFQSPAGQKYLTTFSDTTASQQAAVLKSLQVGIVAFSAGACLLPVAGRNHLWFADFLGMLSIGVGFGFLASAVVSYLIMKYVFKNAKE